MFSTRMLPAPTMPRHRYSASIEPRPRETDAGSAGAVNRSSSRGNAYVQDEVAIGARARRGIVRPRRGGDAERALDEDEIRAGRRSGEGDVGLVVGPSR